MSIQDIIVIFIAVLCGLYAVRCFLRAIAGNCCRCSKAQCPQKPVRIEPPKT